MSHSVPEMDLNLLVPMNPVRFGIELGFLATTRSVNASHCSRTLLTFGILKPS